MIKTRIFVTLVMGTLGVACASNKPSMELKPTVTEAPPLTNVPTVLESQVRIDDPKGKSVASVSLEHKDGTTNLIFNATSLPKGNYVLVLEPSCMPKMQKPGKALPRKAKEVARFRTSSGFLTNEQIVEGIDLDRSSSETAIGRALGLYKESRKGRARVGCGKIE